MKLAPHGGYTQWALANTVRSVDLGTVGYQVVHHLDVAVKRGPAERSGLGKRRLVHLGAVRDEQLDYLQEASGACGPQSRGTVHFLGRGERDDRGGMVDVQYVSELLYKVLYDAPIAVLGGQDERSR